MVSAPPNRRLKNQKIIAHPKPVQLSINVYNTTDGQPVPIHSPENAGHRALERRMDIDTTEILGVLVRSLERWEDVLRRSVRQIFTLKHVHLLAVFILVYVGIRVEVTLGGWIVTYIIDVRVGGPSSGYISSDSSEVR